MTHPSNWDRMDEAASLSRGINIVQAMRERGYITEGQRAERVRRIREKAAAMGLWADVAKGALRTSAPKQVRRREPDTKRIYG